MKQNKFKICICILISAIFIFLIGICAFYSNKNSKKAYIDSEYFYTTPEISGRIEELNAQAGASVKKGEILAKIDSSEYENELEDLQTKLEKLQKELKLSSKDISNINKEALSDKNNMKKAKTELENANSDYTRYKNAYQDGSVTKHDLDKAIQNLKVARENYNSAQNQLKISNSDLKATLSKKNEKNSEIKKLTEEINQTKLKLSYATITSPIDGKLVDSYVANGDIAEAQKPIFRIESDYFVVVALKENETVKENQKVLIKLKRPNAKLKGSVASIYSTSTMQCIKAPCVDKNAKMYAKIVFDDDISKYNITKNTKVCVKIK